MKKKLPVQRILWAKTLNFAEKISALFAPSAGEIKLIHGIHCKRKHQQRIAVALIRKKFMWIIRNHCCLKGNKNPERSRRK
jgi:hypothetical protein